MTRIATLVTVLAATLAGSCAKDAPSSNRSLETQTERATPPASVAEEAEEEGAERWGHKTYPTETIANKGRLGKGKPGRVIAAAAKGNFELGKSWENGPAVIVFYRGHW